MLPVDDINPPVNMLPPVTLPVALTEAADIAADVIKLPPVILPAVIVPVVLIVFDPNAAKNELTLVFEYVAGRPVN